METRELRNFVAVVEELHFGRAAQRLGIAQPPLSRAVRQLERRLGVQLLERTSRGAVLTAVGVVLLDESKAALDAVDAAERRTRRAGAALGNPRVVLVTKAGASTELLAKLLDAYVAKPRAAPVDVDLCGMGQQWRWLRDGRADVALLHQPFDRTAGLNVQELDRHVQVVVLPGGHSLSTRRSLLPRGRRRPTFCALATQRRYVPGRAGPGGARPRADVPARGLRPSRDGGAGAGPRPSALGPLRGASGGRPRGDHSDRLAAAQPVASCYRPGPGRGAAMTEWACRTVRSRDPLKKCKPPELVS